MISPIQEYERKILECKSNFKKLYKANDVAARQLGHTVYDMEKIHLKMLKEELELCGKYVIIMGEVNIALEVKSRRGAGRKRKRRSTQRARKRRSTARKRKSPRARKRKRRSTARKR